MKSLSQHLNESLEEVNEAAKPADLMFQCIINAADEASWFGESSNSEIKSAEKALKNALKKVSNIDKLDAEDLASEIVDEWSFDDDEEAVESIINAGIKLYKEKK